MSQFLQAPPRLDNQYENDRALRSQLRRLLPESMLREIEPELHELGHRAVAEWDELATIAERDAPTLTHFDSWGRRIDHLEISPAWQRLVQVAAEIGVIATAYERKHGALSRLHQTAIMHLYGPSSATASCPMAMTDGAARTLETVGSQVPNADAFKARLVSRDGATAWTAGQWMTEKEGGSDVGRTSTVAKNEEDGWRLYGTKFFTSATTANLALTLARPEGAGTGSRALSMFLVEPWNDDGSLNNIEVRRLKDKLGTKALPTAELELRGAKAHPIGDIGGGGVRNIATVLNICRYWNAVTAVSGMRRGIALALDYAHRRTAFGKRIIEHPLHAETLANLQVEYEGCLAITLRLSELIGKSELGEANAREEGTLRLLTPLAKLYTGKSAVAVASECLESFGGNGYMEGTGLPRLLRDAQVLPIWEGTTNILSLDTLRAIARDNALVHFLADTSSRIESISEPRLQPAIVAIETALTELKSYFAEASTVGPHVTQVGARSFALALSRVYGGALLVEHAAWSLEQGDTTPLVTALRWNQNLTNLVPLDAKRIDEATALLS